MLYDMRLPPGITHTTMAEIISSYEVELIQTDDGPVLRGELEELEKARDHILRFLNERIRELEG
ncbi:hypothetical protein U2150_05620 [Methanothermobacter wolfeii]|uniref:Uncharacterized protein n=1 Tax=Methanothermobacter wolfeii TaxID=145261 RepID=A0A9E7RTJ0_METWO|nr:MULTISPECIES: hypothetical protein [Methanothermobacter]MBC7111846.1 hypothetical protein [Methanothermobacter sp.]MDI6702664.1 hypothetical protein [Methanothermobacter wolfeii]MDI6841607.1 hypothetical protein [Methanothermobacter wolfeii]NLM03043.1 hypothetical protein [Methanothermobacter wolfeii]QHN05863.1 hypothetical protein FZP57_01425 [Methanothermobacter sp. THM-1]